MPERCLEAKWTKLVISRTFKRIWCEWNPLQRPLLKKYHIFIETSPEFVGWIWPFSLLVSLHYFQWIYFLYELPTLSQLHFIQLTVSNSSMLLIITLKHQIIKMFWSSCYEEQRKRTRKRKRVGPFFCHKTEINTNKK